MLDVLKKKLQTAIAQQDKERRFSLTWEEQKLWEEAERACKRHNICFSCFINSGKQHRLGEYVEETARAYAHRLCLKCGEATVFLNSCHYGEDHNVSDADSGL